MPFFGTRLKIKSILPTYILNVYKLPAVNLMHTDFGFCLMQIVEPAKADGSVINPLASWRTSFTASDSHKDREATITGDDDADFVAHCRKRSVEPAHRVLDILSSLSGVSSDEGVNRKEETEDHPRLGETFSWF